MARDELPFSRDLGYLDRFLVSLRAHADALPEPRRGELLRLVSAERDRWDRIKSLLAGQDSEVAEASAGVPASSGLTVGSLIPDRQSAPRYTR